MEIFKEYDSVRLLVDVDADVIGESRKLLLHAGALATVVLVHGDASVPDAYELESYISEQDCYTLATVEASGVARARPPYKE
jgi:hypothetical protein